MSGPGDHRGADRRAARLQAGFRLDDSPGPALPLSDDEADRLVNAALQSVDTGRPIARWGWAAAAAVMLLVITPAAIGAFRAYILPRTPRTPPKVVPAETTAEPVISAEAPTPTKGAPIDGRPTVEPTPAPRADRAPVEAPAKLSPRRPDPFAEEDDLDADDDPRPQGARG